MPLLQGSSPAVISSNVKTLRQEGYPEKQAVAIALRRAGKARKTTQKTQKVGM